MLAFRTAQTGVSSFVRLAGRRRAVTAAVAAFAVVLATITGTPAAANATTPVSAATLQLESTLEAGMLALLNSERAAHHLSALVWSSALHASSYSHDVQMAKYDDMTHQCPGEAAPGTRITKSGYNWQSWGENIGWTTTETVSGIDAMETTMYNEKAPDDGHRLNILGNFKNIAIDVYVDPVHHIIWYTQDFGYPA